MQSSFFIFGGCYNQKCLFRMRQSRQSELPHCSSICFQHNITNENDSDEILTRVPEPEIRHNFRSEREIGQAS
jgi:hypothetical protein